jgi:hypothetical protein
MEFVLFCFVFCFCLSRWCSMRHNIRNIRCEVVTSFAPYLGDSGRFSALLEDSLLSHSRLLSIHSAQSQLLLRVRFEVLVVVPMRFMSPGIQNRIFRTLVPTFRRSLLPPSSDWKCGGSRCHTHWYLSIKHHGVISQKSMQVRYICILDTAPFRNTRN